MSGQLEISGTTYEAEVKSVTATRVEMMAPRFAPTGTGWVVLNVGGKQLRAPVAVVETAPGILTRGGTGTGAAVAFDASMEPITARNPAVMGDLVRIRTTGIGAAVNPANVEIILGNRAIPAGGVTTHPDGYDDISFELPAVEAGCAIPVAVKTGEFVSNYASIAAGSRGTLCPDASRPANYEQLVAEGARIGGIYLGRSEIAMKQFKMRSDTGGASFLRYDADKVAAGFAVNPGVTAGACTLLRAVEQDLPEVPYSSLEAGPRLTVTGTGGAKDMARESKGNYSGRFGEKMMIDIPGLPALPGGL
ncbi:MAG: hypothetical protein JNK48_03180, partial [Bryobacterales bacterium]|nr:hypothetical protein [Bryobacterales bacterium]